MTWDFRQHSVQFPPMEHINVTATGRADRRGDEGRLALAVRKQARCTFQQRHRKGGGAGAGVGGQAGGVVVVLVFSLVHFCRDQVFKKQNFRYLCLCVMCYWCCCVSGNFGHRIGSYRRRATVLKWLTHTAKGFAACSEMRKMQAQIGSV